MSSEEPTARWSTFLSGLWHLTVQAIGRHLLSLITCFHLLLLLLVTTTTCIRCHCAYRKWTTWRTKQHMYISTSRNVNMVSEKSWVFQISKVSQTRRKVRVGLHKYPWKLMHKPGSFTQSLCHLRYHSISKKWWTIRRRGVSNNTMNIETKKWSIEHAYKQHMINLVAVR